MIRRTVQALMTWLKRVITHPRGELTRWQRAVRYGYDLGRYGAKQLYETKAPLMAAALSFRTLFALLPVVVVSTVLVRAVQGTEKFHELIKDAFQVLGLYQYQLGQVTNESLGSWLESLIASATGLNLTALGWTGTAIVAYSAIGLLVTIESSFNAIYRAPEGRSWVRRVPMYWLLLTMSPVVIGITFYIDSRFGQFIGHMNAWKWLLTIANVTWGFCMTWLFIFVMYRLVPNTKVANRPALAGSFIAALLLTIGRGSLGAYFKHAVSLENLYGSLGLIPLFMFWVYLMWMVVLFGLEVSSTLQFLRGRELEEMQERSREVGVVEPASVLVAMQIVAERFNQGLSSSSRQIAEAACIPEPTVVKMIDRLVEAGVLHRLDREDAAVSLTRPPEQIGADHLMEIGFSLVDGEREGSPAPLIERLRETQKRLAAKMTLASLPRDQAVGG